MNWKVKSLLIQIFWFTAILSLCLWLSSCRTQRGAERKIKRLTEQFPELLQKDTIRDTTLVVVPEVYTDTILSLDSIRDTVTITKDRLQIRTVYKDNKIYIEGKCKTDTIEVIKEIPVEKIVIKELNFWEKNRSWIIPVLVLIIGSGIAKRIGLI